MAWNDLVNSPDGSGILLLASLARKRYSGQREIAPKNSAYCNPESYLFKQLTNIHQSLSK
jgi:hypothetical protein